jgi:dienelactone hydrolase
MQRSAAFEPKLATAIGSQWPADIAVAGLAGPPVRAANDADVKRMNLMTVAVGCSSGQSVRVTGPSGVAVTGAASWVSVQGLHAGQRVSAVVTSTDDVGVRWRSATTLKADALGRLRFDAGTLIASMHPLDTDPAGAYFWSTGHQTFHLSIGHSTITVLRQLNRYPVKFIRVRSDGLVATFYQPQVPGRHSAVLLLGGSEGGEPGRLLPAALAGQGHPVLALAYFKAAGLPATLANVPLEYFATALHWLAKQPDVNPARLVVDGASRGGEAALLIGATYPNLVHGVIAGVPSNVAICSYPGCTGPAWTLHGRPVPYTSDFNNPRPIDNPNAVIKVERINGAVLLNCGGDDQIWDSCPYAHAVMSRLTHSSHPHHLEQCARCDHGVGAGIPDEPYARNTPGEHFDEAAFPAFFKATLALLGP